MIKQKNNLVLKNTLLLYIRMIVMTLISLYTSRLVLQILGVVDLGIYNVVGSCVVLFAFINTVMTSASLRFLSFEIGRKDGNISAFFTASLYIHIILSIIFIFICEIISTHLLNDIIKIPPDRIGAAYWVLQFSIFTTALGFLLTPYNALIIALEEMSFYAYISIFNAIIKLLIVYVLTWSVFDNLILYSFLIMLTAFVMQIIYMLYVHIKYKEIKIQKIKNKNIIKKLLSFSGWSLFGAIANTANAQGINIIINNYAGVIASAAISIATQVSVSIQQLSYNFQIAFKPHLIKLYAQNNIREFQDVIIRATKFSFILMLLPSIPVLVETKFILNLWLSEVPPFAVEFVQITLIFILIDCICAPLWFAVQSTGNIKRYQLIVSSIIILNIPVALFLVYLEVNVCAILITRTIINIILWIWRIYFLNGMSLLSIKDYTFEIIIKILPIMLLGTFPFFLFTSESFWIVRISKLIISEMLVIIGFWYIMLIKCDRIYIINFISNFFKNDKV